LNLGNPAGNGQLKVWVTAPKEYIQDGSGQGSPAIINLPFETAVPPRMPGLYTNTKEFTLDTTFCRQIGQSVVLRIKREKNNPEDTLNGAFGISEILINHG